MATDLYPNVAGVRSTIFDQDLQGHGPFTVIGRVQSRIKGEANLIAERAIKWMSPREVVAKRQKSIEQKELFGMTSTLAASRF